jgi:transposase
VAGVESIITSVGALVNFLPPYSPDLNPIEECFSKVKSCLKSSELESNDLQTAILGAFASITPDDCSGWIRDSKAYTS